VSLDNKVMNEWMSGITARRGASPR
jgi:hypothetical protein